MPPRKKKMQQQQQQSGPTPQRPPPTLETLPEVIHGQLALFADKPDNLRQLSKRMETLHGGTLTTLDVKWKATHRVDALVALMQKQHRLQKVVVGNPDAIPALSLVLIAPDCFTHVRELSVVMNFDGLTTAALVQSMAGALRMGGPLPALEVLRLSPATRWQPGMLPVLAGALASGACPSLRVLNVKSGSTFNHHKHEDLEALAAMLEERAQRPACRGLEHLKADGLTLLDDEPSLAVRTRLMRALLPTVRELDHFRWEAAYEECFLAARPPHLERVAVEGAQSFPVDVWEAMPVLRDLSYTFDDVESFILALDRGVAFQQLQWLSFQYMELHHAKWGLLFHALAQAPCMEIFQVALCNVCPAAMATFGDLLGRDTFPKLQELSFQNSSIRDEGVALLANGLLTASRTRVKCLNCLV